MVNILSSFSLSVKEQREEEKQQQQQQSTTTSIKHETFPEM